MTAKKSRKSLDDTLASEFVYGTKPFTQEQIVSSEPVEPSTQEPTEIQPVPLATPFKQSLMSKLMDAPEKEPTVRLTVDLSESMHRKLSILCAKTGRKKAEVVRLLLSEALEDVDT